MNWPLPVRIVGVGSPQGDDAVAWETVRQLRQRIGEQPGIELHALEGGQRLLDLLDGRGSLFLIDAVVGAGEPGTVQRFEWPDPRLEMLRPGSTHGMRPAEALQLADTLGLTPPCIVLFGIQAGTCGSSSGLSAAVVSAVPAVVQRILQELMIDSPAAPK